MEDSHEIITIRQVFFSSIVFATLDHVEANDLEGSKKTKETHRMDPK